MRLLHTTTLELHNFIGDKVPLYAILSHTWGDGEVSFQDMQRGEEKTKLGYHKVVNCCKAGALDGFEYVWIDTCCIDQTSSSELSEAINSMFRWYQDAAVCYVILSDVPRADDPQAAGSAFRRSRWFTRGWTLQELIAPKSLIFFSEEWVDIGTKWSLRNLVSEITNIDIRLFEGGGVDDYSVAQRMSWASSRQTTRPEDMAYCLMGLFGINMPMLYGEGEKAFVRLQEEIIRSTDDQTIFAWMGFTTDLNGSLLALSPRAFAKSGRIVRIPANGESSRIEINNGRIEVQLRMMNMNNKQCVAFLDCKYMGGNVQLGMILKQAEGENIPKGDYCSVKSEYYRYDTYHLEELDISKARALKIATIRNHFKYHFYQASIADSCPKGRGMVYAVLFQPGTQISLTNIHTYYHHEVDQEHRQMNTHFWLPSTSQGFWVLRFKDTSGHHFDMQLKHNMTGTGGLAAASMPKRTPDHFVTSYKTTTWEQESYDRLKWDWAEANMTVFITIKGVAIHGRKVCVVHVNSQELRASA
jgi:hypothetical protein